MNTVTVTDNAERHRYEIAVDGARRGIAEYTLDGDVVTFTHTVVDEAHRNEGLGEQLVRAALDDVRARGRRVVAECTFVVAFLADHPEYHDLEAPPS